MRKRKAFLVASLALLLLGMAAWQCGGAPGSPTPCPPTPTPCDTSALESQLAACQTTQTEIAEDARATIGALQTALAACEGTLCVPRAEVCDNGEDDDCDGLIDTQDPDCAPPPPPGPISCQDAIAYVGEFKTVQGVFYCSYRPDLSGQPTFCNCPVPYPNHDFTALIWGSERPIFESCLGGPPEILLDNRKFSVSGLIEEYDDKPQIILTECGQLAGLQ